MSTLNGILRPIEAPELLNVTIAYRQKGWRLVQICAVRTDEGYELSYSFSMNYDMETLRFAIAAEDEVSSISAVYPGAFLYENEIKELFGVKVNAISTDYHDKLYRIHVKTPFAKKGGNG